MNDLQRLYESAKQQLAQIEDYEVAECWQMLLHALETIREGYGNTGGRVTVSDLQRLCAMIKAGIEWSPEEIGEDLLYMTLLPGNRLEVQLVTSKETCDARLMLTELKHLKNVVATMS